MAWEPPPPRPAGTRGIGELLSVSFSVMRRGVGPLLAISALQVGGVVLALLIVVGFGDYFASVDAWARAIQALAARPRVTSIPAFPMPPVEMILSGVVVAIGWSVIFLALVLAMMSAAGDLIAGRPVAVERALSEGVGRMPAAIGVAVLGVAAVLATSGLLSVLLVLLAAARLAILSVLLIIVALPLMTAIAIRLLPIFPVLVVEGAGPGNAIARAWRLTSRAAWFTFGYSIVTGIIGGLAVAIVGGVVNLVAQPAGDTFGILASFTSSAVVTPWTAVTGVVLYDELRRRSEARTAAASPPAVTASGWGG